MGVEDEDLGGLFVDELDVYELGVVEWP